MGTPLLLSALTLLLVTASVVPEAHYMVVVPGILHYPSEEKVCVLLSSLPERVHLTITLEMKTQNHSIVEKAVEKPGVFECISFQVPRYTPGEVEKEEELAHVHVRVHEAGTVRFEGRKKVIVRGAYTQNLIEPDKPFYKPGDTVRFRIVRLDEEFKAIRTAIPLVQLTDPNNNRIGQWLNVETQQGIADLSFPLASEAALGQYTIQLGEDPLDTNQRSFQVEEYELPKFEVLFEMSPVVTTSDEQIVVTVCGKYTYGKPVHGKVDLRLVRRTSFFFLGGVNEELTTIEREYTSQTEKTGCASFTVPANDINLPEKGYDGAVELAATFTEEGTGVTNTGSDTLKIRVKEMRVEFVHLNPFYKQGFPYTGKMKVESMTPAQNRTVYLTVNVHDVDTLYTYVTDENEEAHFSLDTTGWNNTLVSIRGRHSLENATGLAGAIMRTLDTFHWLKPFYSESNSFLEIQQVEEELPCGSDQEVRVDYIIDRKELGPEADHVDFYYLVVSKGRIVSSGQKQVPIGQGDTLKGTFALTLSTSMELAPTARLLLFAVFADGEVAADVDIFTIEKCLRHQVSVDFSKEEDLPGSKVNLQIEAAPGALCSLRVLDKSVTLKEDPLLTIDKVFETSFHSGHDTVSGRGFSYRLEDFESYPCLLPWGPHPRHRRSLVAPWYQSEADVYSLFKHLRMKILTNTKVKKPVPCYSPQSERLRFRGDGGAAGPRLDPMDMVDMSTTPDSKAKEPKSSKPRTCFPEIWIWDLVAVNEEGKASHPVTAPDTITEWRADAFCVADPGFGLAQPATYRVFLPYFVELTLPFSVIRGETFELKAIVFNYLTDCIQVHVRLAESQQVQVEPCLACRFHVCLCEEEAQTFSWNVTATQLGHVNLSVTTEAEETQELCGNKISVTPAHGRSDTVVKPLLVKPEGILKEETHNAFLCSSGDPVVEEFPLTLPVPVVEDSGRASFSTIGDILGSALQHLDRLIQLPFGCGEQNMVKFVPNIFVLRYLEVTKQATPEIKAKAIDYMKRGYQRQLLYRHEDGSYSAFGKHDSEGNTWLTAFVARAFGQAQSFIYVDETDLQLAVHWLVQHQLPSGCFESVGRLFNNALKGGVDDELSLSAYVLASLLESRLNQSIPEVKNALACLKRNVSSVHDAYPRALLAYVFTLAGDMETRQQLLKDLNEQAERDEGSVSWLETETTAYVLLALLSKPEVSAEDISEASLIAAGLVREQNPYGGFSSTQDTVVALQALALYATLTYREIEHVKVLLKSAAGFQREFHVDKETRLLLQEASLPEVPGQYTVEVSGSGCVYVQSTLRYNHPPEKTDAFTLKVETSPQECNRTSRKHFDIHIQVSYVGPRESSNMALIEVNMVSGFIPVKKSVKSLPGTLGVKKVEFDPDKITLYLDELDVSVRSYHFSVEQEVEVTGLKPAAVKVYDYYHPEDYAVAEYNAPCSSEITKE